MSTPPSDAASTDARQQRFRRITDDTILDAAGTVFARVGFTAASMAAIAEEAGSTKPTLYARIGSKEDLYGRVLAREAQRFVATMVASHEALTDASVTTMVESLMQTCFAFFESHPAAFSLVFSAERADPATRIAEEVIGEVTDQLQGLVSDVLARNGREVRPEYANLLAAMLLGVAHHALGALERQDELEAQVVCDIASSFALGALRQLDPTLLEATV